MSRETVWTLQYYGTDVSVKAIDVDCCNKCYQFMAYFLYTP